MEPPAVKEPTFELPPLRRVPSSNEVPKTSEIVKEPAFELPPLRHVPPYNEGPKTLVDVKPLPLPQLRPVAVVVAAAAPAAAAVSNNVEPAAVEWQPPPLDSRPNLQALLEKENEKIAVVNAPPAETLAQLKPVNKTKEVLQPLAASRNGLQFLDGDEIGAVDDEELVHVARLSVRGRVQRFESVKQQNHHGLVSMSLPTSLRNSGANTPARVKAATFLPPPTKPAAVNVSNDKFLKENTAPKVAIVDKAIPALPAVKQPIQAEVHLSPAPPVVQLRQSASTGAVHLPPIVQPAAPQPCCPMLTIETVDSIMKRRSLADFTNHNTAPRGWTASVKEIYRPITFNHG